jgi:hypothetical protein
MGLIIAAARRVLWEMLPVAFRRTHQIRSQVFLFTAEYLSNAGKELPPYTDPQLLFGYILLRYRKYCTVLHGTFSGDHGSLGDISKQNRRTHAYGHCRQVSIIHSSSREIFTSYHIIH